LIFFDVHRKKYIEIGKELHTVVLVGISTSSPPRFPLKLTVVTMDVKKDNEAKIKL
jgi:hypothetical protein